MPTPQRLFMDEIVSVGLVRAGDNPGAKVTVVKSQQEDGRITIWKKRQPTVTEWAAAQHARLDALAERIDKLKTRKEELTPEERERRFHEIVEGARRTRRLEELQRQQRAQRFQPLADLLTGKEGPTMDTDEPLREAIGRAVNKKARVVQAATPQLYGEHIARVRVKVWKSEEGRKLWALANSEHANEPVSKIAATIAKSDEHAEALAIMKRWQAAEL